MIMKIIEVVLKIFHLFGVNKLYPYIFSVVTLFLCISNVIGMTGCPLCLNGTELLKFL